MGSRNACSCCGPRRGRGLRRTWRTRCRTWRWRTSDRRIHGRRTCGSTKCWPQTDPHQCWRCDHERYPKVSIQNAVKKRNRQYRTKSNVLDELTPQSSPLEGAGTRISCRRPVQILGENLDYTEEYLRQMGVPRRCWSLEWHAWSGHRRVGQRRSNDGQGHDSY